jgi:hypothetical protein
MSVLRLSAGGVSFRHRPCVAGHGPGIRVVTGTLEGNLAYVPVMDPGIGS